MRFDQLAAVTGGKLYNVPNHEATFTGVSIDSRTLHDGELFFAIRGENQDGHRYIPGALERGAAGIVAESAWSGLDALPAGVPVITVENTHEAMIALATEYRHSIDARFAAITGSNGKTTTKELTFHLLHALEPRTYRSPGNLNNLYGVPLALFRIPTDCRLAVLELGISTAMEMPRLADIVEPDVVAITNVSATHLEFLKSVEAVAQAKLELVRRSGRHVPAVINADDPVLLSETKKVRDRFTTFGIDTAADFKPDSFEILSSGGMSVVIEGHPFVMPLVGRHQVYNLLAAYAIARALGRSFKDIDTAAITLETAPLRGQMLERGGIRFLVDCYNANPENVRAGLAAYFATDTPGRRVLILGDMLELGERAADYHRRIGKLLAEHEFSQTILVGPLSQHTLEGAAAAGIPKDRLLHFGTAKDCANHITGILEPGDFVYLKGSRGIGLEVILDTYDSPREAR